jgi:hypothetical protein
LTAAADEQGIVLEAFSRALSRESRNLRERPDLLWQQMYNRLQWAEEPLPGLIGPERSQRSAPGSAPWLWTRTRLQESEALRLVLSGHTNSVKACAISPDSSFIASASWDGTCKIWDTETGRERATLSGHTGWVWACAISPDSSFIVSANNDGTCKIWDAETGRELASYHYWAAATARRSLRGGRLSPAATPVGTSTRSIWSAFGAARSSSRRTSSTGPSPSAARPLRVVPDRARSARAGDRLPGIGV